MIKVKILKGNRKNCIKLWPKDKAKKAIEDGNAILVDQPKKEGVVTRPLEPSNNESKCEGIRSDGEPCQMPVEPPNVRCRYHKED